MINKNYSFVDKSEEEHESIGNYFDPVLIPVTLKYDSSYPSKTNQSWFEVKAAGLNLNI